MAVIGETPGEKEERETRLDCARRTAIKISEITDEPLEYIDPYFELDERTLMRRQGGFNRLPKCLTKNKKENKMENEETETAIVKPIRVEDELAIDLDKVTDGLKTIRKFQAIVKKLTTEGVDYGVIPGTQKPTLLKPGAEKITKLMSLSDSYTILKSQEDYDKGFFAYTVKCRLAHIQTGNLVSEGVGQCNSKESKYRWRWLFANELPPDIDKSTLKKQTGMSRYNKPYTRYRVENEDIFSQVNTILKMAKKRALVDAALSAGRLSEIFTQDMEDIGNRKSETSEKQSAKKEKAKTPQEGKKPIPTKEQNVFKTVIKKKLIDQAKELGYSEDMMVVDTSRLSKLIWNALGGKWPESDADVLLCTEVLSPKDFMSAKQSETTSEDDIPF